MHLFHKIYQNQHFLLFILLFAYIQSVYTRISVRQQINAYTFTPEAAFATLVGVGVLFLIILIFIRKWQKSDTFSTRVIVKIFAYSLLIFVFTMQLIGFLIAFAFDKVDLNFNRHAFTITLLSDFLNGMIYGSFFLAYYYYNKTKTHQQKLSMYNKALAESRINKLKAQINPHFLFNNLNVLDQLIEEDKHKASDFLNEFAEIYRYVLQSSEKELISVNEEIDFAKQYFKLIQQKYGNTYQLDIEKNADGFVVPLSLQLTIENAVQHNIGTLENPICIHVKIGENVIITNNSNLKRSTKLTSGRALKNLKEQYQLLSDKPIEIYQTEKEFSVTIPFIHM